MCRRDPSRLEVQRGRGVGLGSPDVPRKRAGTSSRVAPSSALTRSGHERRSRLDARVDETGALTRILEPAAGRTCEGGAQRAVDDRRRRIDIRARGGRLAGYLQRDPLRPRQLNGRAEGSPFVVTAGCRDDALVEQEGVVGRERDVALDHEGGVPLAAPRVGPDVLRFPAVDGATLEDRPFRWIELEVGPDPARERGGREGAEHDDRGRSETRQSARPSPSLDAAGECGRELSPELLKLARQLGHRPPPFSTRASRSRPRITRSRAATSLQPSRSATVAYGSSSTTCNRTASR